MFPKYIMMIDVESIGLHGEGFAVGWCVRDAAGNDAEQMFLSCPPESARGDDEGRAWVAEHVPAMTATHATPREMRADFWRAWLYWKERGAVMASDCGWPVEARFLAACVDDEPEARAWQGPYPLHDLASAMLAIGADPLATYPRGPIETPAHHPMHDAMQSARLLFNAMQRTVPARPRAGERT